MKTLVLDLDNTLIHTSHKDKPDSFDFHFVLDKEDYYVQYRLGLKKFIKYAESNFNIIVWTSSTMDYARPIVDKIFNKKIQILDREDNTIIRISERQFDDIHAYPHIKNIIKSMNYWNLKDIISYNDSVLYIKPIKKLKKYINFNIKEIICIDNDPYKFFRSYANYFYIKDFEGDADHELSRVEILLNLLKDLDDVRINKLNHKETCFP